MLPEKIGRYMNLNRKEIYWLIGIIIFILIFNFTILGIDCLSDATIDINVHDTYFIIAKVHFFVLFTFLIFYFIYFIRMLRRNFKNLIANLFFLTVNIFVIILITQIISFINSISEITGKTEYPPLSGGAVEHKGNEFGFFSNSLLIFQILLIIFQSYVCYKTAINYKQKN